MAKKSPGAPGREGALSRERIIQASIAILDARGEAGLTFRALSERLATGPGAIYWHIANKSDLLTAACDAIVARTTHASVTSAKPKATIRAIALGMFDAIDAHPWVGTALTQAPGELPLVRILEGIGHPVQALGVPVKEQRIVVGTLLNYILGVGGQNAANRQLARARNLDRSDFLDAVATRWSKLDAREYPFTRSIARGLRTHDDREDFLAGIDLILIGIDASSRR